MPCFGEGPALSADLDSFGGDASGWRSARCHFLLIRHRCLVLTSSDTAEKTKKLSAVLANGSLAMIAIIGMFIQDELTGSAYGDKALDTASPLRTFEIELGAQAPIGICDPSYSRTFIHICICTGFTADGNFENVARRRQTELQRGRVSMLTTMRCITLEIVVKLPGCLSPSAGLKFTDIPNRLAAIYEVPAGGGGQILAYGSFGELS